MRHYFIAAAAAVAACFAAPAAYAVPPIEAYGELPEIRAFDISPDGSRYAFFRRQGDKEILAVFESGKGAIATLDVTDVKPRNVWFQTNDYLFVVASQATKRFGGYEDGQVFVFDVRTQKAEPLADKERSFRFLRSGLGGIIARTDKPTEVFISAWVGEKGDYPTNELLRLNLDTGRASRFIRGGTNTVDWLVTPEGVVLGREEFDGRGNFYHLYTRKDGNWKLLYEEKTNLQHMSMVGYKADMSGLIVHVESDGEGDAYKLVSFDGGISPFDFDAPESGTQFVIMDKYRKMIGAGATGLRTARRYDDSQLTQVMNSVAAKFPHDQISLIDWTDDWNQLVIRISGGATAPAYFLADRLTGAFGKLAPQYLRIKDEDVAPVTLTEYSARDGLAIPTVLTHPKGARAGSKLPLVVIPHGGPESYDSLGFDYFAQFFASRGYLVLQPNFRGSAGFGASFREAGHGEWGAKMQDDVTDGVNYLIDSGWADSDRICIVGASYGGYAALAGGAFTPDLYKCVAAIAPVSDIPTMLEHEARVTGRYSSTSDYWRKVIGDRSSDSAKLEAISPARRAKAFKAPVLLIHGIDDTVVPYNQSTRMEDALRAAGKNVTLVKLKAEDHWLSSSETRLQALRETDRFVNEHIGPAN